MPPGSLFFAARAWLWPAALGFLILAACVVWSYRGAAVSPRWRATCALLKLLGCAILLACLLEPTWTGQKLKTGANLFTVVADDSLSMQLHGRGETEARGDALRKILTGPGSQWHRQLAENFTVRDFLAATRLQPVQDFQELRFAGRSSALGGALQALGERFRGQPLAGILLLTDGVASDLDGVDLHGLPPVYPVVFGSDQPPRDLALVNTSVTQTAFEDAPVTVQADVTATDYANEKIVGKLFAVEAATPGAAPKVVAEQTLTVGRPDEKMVFRFSFRPEKSGVLFYRIRIGSAVEWDAPASTEATLANNETIVTVDRGAGPYRVLYVSGRPNWEYKFLRRAVQADDQTQLVGLIRIAKREPKFDFRGRGGEASNPLFRGFGQQGKEEAERYDQPVFVRLETKDEFELRGGFPKTEEDLFQYRAIILDDLEAEFFTADQMSLLQRFVSERGGGLLMLGGAESFAEGKFARTALGDLLPVYLDHAPALPGGTPLQLTFTREGWLQPWARLRPNEAEERQRLRALPHFETLNAVRGMKPAAMVVATVNDGRTDYPALVTQRFGRGRSSALLLGDFWQSGLGDEALQKDLGKAWRQMVRWLVADVPEPIEVRAEAEAATQSVRLRVRVRDPKFQPAENASVTLQVQPATGGPAVTLSTEPSAEEPGLYEASYTPRENGGYRIEAAVTGDTGERLGTAAAGWTTDLAATEFRSLSPNRALMENVARQTGGKVVLAEQLEAFVRDLPTVRAPVMETWTRPLWHTPIVLVLALLCFVAEWGLRRWKGLA